MTFPSSADDSLSTASFGGLISVCTVRSRSNVYFQWMDMCPLSLHLRGTTEEGHRAVLPLPNGEGQCIRGGGAFEAITVIHLPSVHSCQPLSHGAHYQIIHFLTSHYSACFSFIRRPDLKGPHFPLSMFPLLLRYT